MAINVQNSNIGAVYYGNQTISEIYYGNSLVWSSGVTLTIRTTPSLATVTFSTQGNIIGKSIKVKKGTAVTYTVTYTGYHSKTETVTVNSTTTKSVVLTSKTQNIPNSAATKTQYDGDRIYACPNLSYGNSYRFTYSFIKGKSYTIKYVISRGAWLYEAMTTNVTTINTSKADMTMGRPTSIVQTIFSTNNGSESTDSTTIEKTFTATDSASYIVLNQKGVGYYPLVGSLIVIEN